MILRKAKNSIFWDVDALEPGQVEPFAILAEVGEDIVSHLERDKTRFSQLA